MAEERVIREGDPLYPILYQRWVENDRPERVFWGGDAYIAVIDNEEVRFALEGGELKFASSVSIKKS
jgi:hypothetical protein